MVSMVAEMEVIRHIRADYSLRSDSQRTRNSRVRESSEAVRASVGTAQETARRTEKRGVIS